MTKVERHMDICKHLNGVYEKKNHDYGDSFHDTFVEEGFAMARIRLADKLNRFKKLSRDESSRKVDDESLRDTLLDLANYSIMTVMEMDIQAEEDEKAQLKANLDQLRVIDPIQLPQKSTNGKMNSLDDLDSAGIVSEREIEERNRQLALSRSTLPQNFINDGERICPKCGNKMEWHSEKGKYTCGNCGAMYSISASNGKPDTDPDPCKKCTYPDKATCCGCADRIKWERRQRGDMDVAEAE